MTIQMQNFKFFLKNKTIAIVGVSNSKYKNGNEIRKKDVVIKLNFYSEKNYNNKLTQSDRCDISYLSDFFITNKIHLLKKNKNKVKFFVVKNNNIKNINKIDQNKKIISKENRDVLLGTPSLLIRTILDLLKYETSSIKIFNSTLQYPIKNQIRNYNTKKYRKFPLEKKFKIFTNVQGFGVHDIISEFIIVSNLFKKKLIKVDKNLEKILKNGLHAYLKKMELFYLNSIIKLIQR